MHFIPAPFFVARKETKHCRIFAKQMYGPVTCVAGYRRFRPSIICPASMMQDTAPSIAKQLSYEGFPKRKSQVRSMTDSEAGRIFESESNDNHNRHAYPSWARQ